MFHDYFAAGASYYGVADAETLATDTHKFESRYLDGLIGPYPEARDLYRQRSPIDYVDQLSCPVIIFQGLEDEIVPPSQAEAMVEGAKGERRAIRLSAVPGRAARLQNRSKHTPYSGCGTVLLRQDIRIRTRWRGRTGRHRGPASLNGREFYAPARPTPSAGPGATNSFANRMRLSTDGWE